jgi:hypothetical protein
VQSAGCAHRGDDETKSPAGVLILDGSVSVGTEAVHAMFMYSNCFSFSRR